MIKFHTLWATIGEVLDVVRSKEITFLAAAIAYYGFVSLLPALLLAVAVATIIGGDPLVETVLEGSSEFVTPAGQDALENALTSASGRSGATIIGVGLLVWSALRVFKAIDIAFSRIFETASSDSILTQTKDALVVFVTIGLGLWVMLVVGGVLVTLLPVGGDILGLLLLLVGLTIVFLPLYYWFPDADLSISEALPGTVLAALGWVVLQAGFQVYAARAEQFQIYGVIGAILLLVTWFYLGSILLLLGATLNRVLA